MSTNLPSGQNSSKSDTWSDFLKLVQDYGFQTIVKQRFNYSLFSEQTQPELIICAHPKKYLLLCATSYPYSSGAETINGGNVYGALVPVPTASQKERSSALNGCSSLGGRDDRIEFEVDVRHEPITKLNELGKVFQFVKWHNPNRFLWLLDFNQDDQEPRPWKEERDKFLAAAPDWVRDFIC